MSPSGQYSFTIQEDEMPTRPQNKEALLLLKLMQSQELLKSLMRHISPEALSDPVQVQNISIGVSVLISSLQDVDAYVESIRHSER